MTDTTPAALERVMERLRQLARGAGSTTQSTCTEAAAVIAVLGVERDASVTALRSVVTANVENMRLASSAEAKLREIRELAITRHTYGDMSDLARKLKSTLDRILAIARTVGEKDNG